MTTTRSFHRFHVPWLIFASLVVGFALWRAGQHTWDVPFFNFTPIGAGALFGGMHFRTRKQAYLMPILAMFLSDLLLSYTTHAKYDTGFLYAGWEWSYFAFFCMVMLGRWGRPTLWRTGFSGLGAALIHWILSDIGPCFSGSLRGGIGVESIATCYISAIPWSLRFLYATWLHSIVLFGGFALFKSYIYPVIYRKKWA